LRLLKGLQLEKSAKPSVGKPRPSCLPNCNWAYLAKSFSGRSPCSPSTCPMQWSHVWSCRPVYQPVRLPLREGAK